MILRRFDTVDAAAAALAAQIGAALREALTARTRASLLVPGGRTPVSLFRVLRDAELDWSRVAIGLTDERWVPASDAASNAALVTRELLQHRAAPACFVPLYDGAASAAQAVPQLWNSLAEMPRPWDAVVLGVGEDGHFASLFPASPGVAHALDPEAPPACVATRAPVPPTERISLNLAALLQARRLFLFVTGEAKRSLIESAVHRPELPVSALLAPGGPEAEVYWAA